MAMPERLYTCLDRVSVLADRISVLSEFAQPFHLAIKYLRASVRDVFIATTPPLSHKRIQRKTLCRRRRRTTHTHTNGGFGFSVFGSSAGRRCCCGLAAECSHRCACTEVCKLYGACLCCVWYIVFIETFARRGRGMRSRISGGGTRKDSTWDGEWWDGSERD